MDRRDMTPAPPNLTPAEYDAWLGLRAAQRLAHHTATEAGWYTDPATGEPVERSFGEIVTLMQSRLSEALEAYRQDLMDDRLTHRTGVEVEFADCLIRILSAAATRRLDLAGVFIEKNRYNRDRANPAQMKGTDR